MDIFPLDINIPKSHLINSLNSFTQSVKANYLEYVNNGLYDSSNETAFYVYQISRKDGKYTGFLACVDAEDVQKGKIVKHENTLASKEQEVLYLLMERGAMIKPVLMSYPDQYGISQILNKAKSPRQLIYKLNDKERKEEHLIWKMSGDAQEKLLTIFHEIPEVYIADGHHRTSAQYILSKNEENGDKKYSKIFAALFSFENLKILDYNRIVQLTINKGAAYLMALLSSIFVIKPIKKATKPSKKGEITMYMDKEWYLLKWKKSIVRDLKEETLLDADLFNRFVLHDLFDVENIREDSRIKYSDGTVPFDQFMLKVLRVPNSIGFMLYPVDVWDLKAVADAGATMPPKSTYFEPRMINGLITKKL